MYIWKGSFTWKITPFFSLCTPRLPPFSLQSWLNGMLIWNTERTQKQLYHQARAVNSMNTVVFLHWRSSPPPPPTYHPSRKSRLLPNRQRLCRRFKKPRPICVHPRAPQWDESKKMRRPKALGCILPKKKIDSVAYLTGPRTESKGHTLLALSCEKEWK